MQGGVGGDGGDGQQEGGREREQASFEPHTHTRARSDSQNATHEASSSLIFCFGLMTTTTNGQRKKQDQLRGNYSWILRFVCICWPGLSVLCGACRARALPHSVKLILNRPSALSCSVEPLDQLIRSIVRPSGLPSAGPRQCGYMAALHALLYEYICARFHGPNAVLGPPKPSSIQHDRSNDSAPHPEKLTSRPPSRHASSFKDHQSNPASRSTPQASKGALSESHRPSAAESLGADHR